MPTKILDIPKIQKKLLRLHSTFMQDFGNAIVKVSADQELTLARMSSKISRILECMMETQAIDKFSVCDDSMYKGFHLIKNGMTKSIYIWIDGRDVLLKDSNLSIRYGLKDPLLKMYAKIDVDNFDWENFAVELLEYVHQVIYQSKEASSVKVFGVNSGE